jgi:D-glycero-alpha-D-manno-heptose 1-phosphate guanylyltransferase
MAGSPIGAILAGGLGTRLRPAVADSAKVVAPVAGRPFLQFLLEQLRTAGVREVVLCTGYQAQQVERQIGLQFKDLQILYSTENDPLGTGGALRQAWQRVRDRAGAGWLVMNGDSYCDIDLARFWREHERADLPATLAAVEVPDGARYGTVRWDSSGRVTEFEEKQAGGARWINAGIYGFGSEFLDALAGGSWSSPLSLERDVLPQWIPRGIHVFAQPARFIDIGTPDSYRAAQAFFGEAPS